MTQLVTYATAASRTVAAMIHATPIRRDAEGRYCLNDLHRAAGGQPKHQPAHFMVLDSTKALVEAISNSRVSEIKPVEASRGRYGGTYVHEDLAIDYAAWISPAFKLEVYRAFKETRKTHETDVGNAIVPAGTSLSALLRMAMEAAEEKERLEAELEAARPSSWRCIGFRPFACREVVGASQSTQLQIQRMRTRAGFLVADVVPQQPDAPD